MNRYYKWSRDENRALDYSELRSRLTFLDQQVFRTYEPTKTEGASFTDRLESWLNSAGDEEDQRLLFELLDYLYFVGPDEFEILYQDAYNGPIAWWLIDQLHLTPTSGGLRDAMERARDATWFCPVTDSMQIARFYHLHNLSGKNLRPDWHALSRLGDPKKVCEYMVAEQIERIVLLEDFVGTGRQVTNALNFASELPGKRPVLFCPLIITPSGLERLRNEFDGKNLSIEPIVVLNSSCILGEDPGPDEPERFPLLRDLLLRLRPLVGAPARPSRTEEAFGFGGSGTLTVLYTNCPNNTPPAVHHSSDRWRALFPRSSRL